SSGGLPMRKAKVLGGCVVACAAAAGLLYAALAGPGQAQPLPIPIPGPVKPPNPGSAKAVAREWEDPGGIVVSCGREDAESICMEWGTADAAFDEVAKFYAKRCGRDKIDGPAFVPLDAKGKDKGDYNMIASRRAKECDFAQHTGRHTVHVTIREVEKN